MAGMDRRQVLKAAGVTSTIPFASGLGAASGGDNRGGGREQRACPQSNCIHPVLGYSGLEGDGQLPEPLQPDHEVDLETRPQEGRPVPEFYFEPTGRFVEAGDVVRFNLATPDHTVTAYHPRLGRQRRVPEGIPPFSSPVLGTDAFWLYRFDEPGVYDVLCAPHEIFGMVMRIVVGEPTAEFGPEGTVETEGGEIELRPPALTAALVYDDPMLEPATIAEQGSISWDDLMPESKRLLVEFPEPPAE
jgi:plastocyanin